MFVSNLTFLGPLASGKTSLLRNLQGKSFRLTEPHTLNVFFSETYFSLVDHLDWSPTSAALTYEDELVHIIIDELLKHAAKKSASSRRSTGSDGEGGMGTGFGFGTGDGMGMGGGAPPPLPPVPLRRRSQSFTDRSIPPELEAAKASHRLSGSFEVLESSTPEGKLQLGYRADLDDKQGRHHGNSHQGGRKSFMSRLFPGKGRGKVSLRRHYSDSVRSSHLINVQTGGTNIAVAMATRRVSSLPERLVEKIRDGMRDCTDSSLPARFFGRLIELPGAKSFRTVRSLFPHRLLCVCVGLRHVQEPRCHHLAESEEKVLDHQSHKDGRRRPQSRKMLGREPFRAARVRLQQPRAPLVTL